VTLAAAAPAPTQAPVAIRIGNTVLTLGSLSLPATGDPRHDLAHLLRVAAEHVDGRRHDWPRRVWCVGDRVRLPHSLAYGRVVQVDEWSKQYLLDVGPNGRVHVPWSDVDEPTARRADEDDDRR
jgi:hypothetical protein